MQIDSWKDEDFWATPYEIFFMSQQFNGFCKFGIHKKMCLYGVAWSKTSFAQISAQLERNIAYES